MAIGAQTQFDPSVANAVLVTERNSIVSQADDEDDLLGKLSKHADPMEKIKPPVMGPLVSNQVKSMFDNQDGKGSMAFNKEGVWDGVNIWQTVAWPSTCKYGKYQSPVHVDMNERFHIEANALQFVYQPQGIANVSSDGYKVILSGDFGYALFGSHVFFVDEVDIHHPSEHTLGENEERTDFEIEIIHSDSFGLQISVSVFLNNSGNNASNLFLQQLGFGVGAEPLNGDTTSLDASNVNLQSLVEGSTQYISYDGSLTSPPCTEGVKWFLLNERGDVGEVQIAAFNTIFGKSSNVRGTQPLNGRAFSLFSE